MKKTILTILAVFLMAGSAFALPSTVTDTTTFLASGTDEAGDLISYGWGAVNKLNGFGDWVRWEHTYTFDPELVSVTSATLTLSFSDDGDRRREYAFGYAESGDWDLGEVDTGDYIYHVGLSAVADGAFAVTLASFGGDFFINSSELYIEYDGAAPVPEPATILLMGLGLVGLAASSRKKLLKK